MVGQQRKSLQKENLKQQVLAVVAQLLECNRQTAVLDQQLIAEDLHRGFSNFTIPIALLILRFFKFVFKILINYMDQSKDITGYHGLQKREQN